MLENPRILIHFCVWCGDITDCFRHQTSQWSLQTISSGPHLNIKTVCPGTWISIIKIIRSWLIFIMMTSSNGNIFRVTGHLCGECTGPWWIPAQRPVTRSFVVSFDKRLSKQSCRWWFETLSRPLWRQYNDNGKSYGEWLKLWSCYNTLEPTPSPLSPVITSSAVIRGDYKSINCDYPFCAICWMSPTSNKSTVDFRLPGINCPSSWASFQYKYHFREFSRYRWWDRNI